MCLCLIVFDYFCACVFCVGGFMICLVAVYISDYCLDAYCVGVALVIAGLVFENYLFACLLFVLCLLFVCCGLFDLVDFDCC